MDAEVAARKLRITFDMFEFGEKLQRQRLRRVNPEATDADIDKTSRWFSPLLGVCLATVTLLIWQAVGAREQAHIRQALHEELYGTRSSWAWNLILPPVPDEQGAGTASSPAPFGARLRFADEAVPAPWWWCRDALIPH